MKKPKVTIEKKKVVLIRRWVPSDPATWDKGLYTKPVRRKPALWKQIADAKAARKARRAAFYAGRAGTRTLAKTPTSRKSPARAPKAAQGAPLKRKATRIRPRSRRMTKVKAYYYELRDEFLAEHTVCTVHGGNCVATECHHVRGRAATLLIDARWWMAVCHSAHCFIHEEPAMAREDGLLCAKGQWNHPPEDAETRRLRGIIQELTK